MRTDKNIYLAVGQILQDSCGLFRRASPGEIIHSDRQVLQSVGESLVVLIRQYGSRHQHCHLLRVASGLERRTHRHFGFTKAHIAAYQSVHGLCLLHIGLHIVSCFQLVGRIFIQETGLQLLLHEGVCREGEASFPTAGRIELDEVAGNILQLCLSALLHAFPLASSQMRQPWRLSPVLSLVLRHLI